MNIFISGATGFVGGHLAENLIKEGHKIRTLARPSSNASFIKSLGVEIAYGDLVDYPSVKKAVEGCEVIYHTARAKPENTPRKSVYFDVNVKGTDNVMRAALETGAGHVVHFSSTTVYGQPEKIPVDENTPPKPIRFHEMTKLEGEKVVLEYTRKQGISVVIARLTHIFGPRDLRLTSLFQRILNKKFIMFGPGNVYFHVTYIDDIVDGLKLCAGKRNSAGECYIIAGEEAHTLSQFLRMIAEECGVELNRMKLPIAPFALMSDLYGALLGPFGMETYIRHKVDFFTRERMYDISKAKRELGYSPRVSLREGIKHTMNWYRENGYL